ncbi:hypothetical protein [Planktothricoides raciborskii]|uniref:Uncharacterized protein n=1 Tax=Planktothricoides raciborskii FACHB-1370 TaxID=2949576 RepID=A0ABR8EBG3_9CYAN|nr:hypothetical protein [Planktothricoides raciborskii]MBD2543910.1 hypothetical protein [Planktothricoides raciborskii FACHB-1370]
MFLVGKANRLRSHLKQRNRVASQVSGYKGKRYGRNPVSLAPQTKKPFFK